MNFKAATDVLLEAGGSLRELADELGCSHGLLRQARLDESASSYRTPPEGWEEAIQSVARRRGGKLCGLADRLNGSEKNDG